MKLQHDRFGQILRASLPRPLFLTEEELDGKWREALPELSGHLPAPYPVFGLDEENIVAWGYPILISEGMRRLHRQLEGLVGREMEYRLLDNPEDDDRAKVLVAREGYGQSLERVFENTLLNDYGRGLVEVFLLYLSSDIQSTLAVIPRLIRARSAGARSALGIRRQLASNLGGQIVRAASAAADRVRRLADAAATSESSPLLRLLCQDPLLLVENRLSVAPSRLASLLPSRTHGDVEQLLTKSRDIVERLREVLRARPDVWGIVRVVCGPSFDPLGAHAGLEPRLLDLIGESGLLPGLELGGDDLERLQRLGKWLKALEFVAALRESVLSVESRTKDGWAIRLPNRRVDVAASTRPYDFASYGVVDSAVYRFGLIYDLTNFTAVLERVRQTGRNAEEKALQFMYIFQRRAEEIRERRRLNFEKFMGDGAFFSARRALRILAAACEIQQAYDRLRRQGFPFDQGVRIAVNAAEYRLLPMGGAMRGAADYEFFGHGIVELARMTTGKSTQQLEEMADLLVHGGYDPEQVDGFLAPLVASRGQVDTAGKRTYQVALDSRGELVNEGIVLTVPFVQALEEEMGSFPVWVADRDGLSWLVLKLGTVGPRVLAVGLRLLGVARLKGLAPMELVEAMPWPQNGTAPQSYERDDSLLDTLRKLARSEESSRDELECENSDDLVLEDMVVACFQEPNGCRQWVFGRYREIDDMLLQALKIPLKVPASEEDLPLEMWLFRNRSDLARVYDTLMKESSGVATPLGQLRQRPGFQAWFLAAPHRSP